MFLFVGYCSFLLIGLIVGRWWALWVPAAVMVLFLSQAAISNQLGDGTFTDALSDVGALLLLAGVLGIAEAGTVLGVYIRQRLASRLAKPS